MGNSWTLLVGMKSPSKNISLLEINDPEDFFKRNVGWNIAD